MLNITDLENMSKEELNDFVSTFNQYMKSEEQLKQNMKNEIDELKYELEQSRNLLHNLNSQEYKKEECEDNDIKSTEGFLDGNTDLGFDVNEMEQAYINASQNYKC